MKVIFRSKDFAVYKALGLVSTTGGQPLLPGIIKGVSSIKTGMAPTNAIGKGPKLSGQSRVTSGFLDLQPP